MKHILALVLSMTALSAQASITCKGGDYGLVIDGQKAIYQFEGVQVAQVENVQAEKSAEGGEIYSTDFAFRLTVQGNNGAFVGLWPNPMGMFSETAPLVLTCQ